MHLILVADYFQQTRELRKGRVACKYGIEITNQENVTNVSIVQPFVGNAINTCGVDVKMLHISNGHALLVGWRIC